jgi:hypothetical protein
MKRKGDNITYEGALFALQNQAKLTIHPGAGTALALQGKAHYLELSAKSITLFGAQNEDLPSWFKKYHWGYSVHLQRTNFLPPNLGLKELEIRNFKILVSDPARAMLESLYLVPKHHSLLECHEIMEGMNNLRPSKVQELLEQCGSVKVKRMFLYLAERSGHDWVKYIEMGKIDLGSGKREIVKGGAYNSKYQITVDKELEGKE